MTNHHKNYDDYKDAIDELRRLAREPYEASDELVKLRKRITSERGRVHRGILERVAQQAHVDLQSIFDEARRRNAAKHKYVTETLNLVLAQVAERAKAQAKHFHRIRADYVRDYSALVQRTPQLKFHQPISTSSNAKRGDCNYIVGGCSPNAGSYEASAEFGPDPAGIWLFPFLSNDSGDCDDTTPATTLHDLTFQMSAPTTSFAVSSIRVDLIANGVAASHLGDAGFFHEASHKYVHSFIDMDVWIAQQVYGRWAQWPLLSDRLFEGAGDYAKQIQLVLSGQTYPSAIVILKPDDGGGDILCHMQIVCSTNTIGTDGRSLLDFRAEHGMFVGGVALLGDFV
jgi:hypothetical protein